MAGSFTNVLLHIVFSTKDRERTIPPEFAAELYAYLGGIARGEGGQLTAAGGTADHVHLLVLAPKERSLADLVRRLKGNSSHWVNEKGKLPTRFAWQRGYGAFSVSESAREQVAAYIADQAEHHRRRTFQEEFVAFLRKHNIRFDPRYIWD
jgi:putative transposase